MAIQGNVINLYSNEEPARALFPRTKIEAISDKNGNTLENILSSINNSWRQIQIILSPSNWSNQSQTISDLGITTSDLILYDAAPGDDNMRAFDEAGIYMSSQSTNSVTFRYYETQPSSIITINLFVRAGA